MSELTAISEAVKREIAAHFQTDQMHKDLLSLLIAEKQKQPWKPRHLSLDASLVLSKVRRGLDNG